MTIAGRPARTAHLLLEPGGGLAGYLPVRLHAPCLPGGHHHRSDGGSGRLFRRAARPGLCQPHARQHRLRRGRRSGARRRSTRSSGCWLSPWLARLVWELSASASRSAMSRWALSCRLALGLGILFISLYQGYSTDAYAVLFGEVLGISQQDVVIALVVGALTLLALGSHVSPAPVCLAG